VDPPSGGYGNNVPAGYKEWRFYPLRPWVFMGDQERGDLPLTMVNDHPGAEVGGDFSVFFVIVRYYEY